MKKLAIIFFLSVISGLACGATVSDSRRAYITSRPHGWVEISFFDQLVPFVPTSDSDSGDRSGPEKCTFTLKLNGELFLTEDLFPIGPTEPFVVETGFRFPAPIGKGKLDLTYRGCRFEGNKEHVVKASTRIQIHSGMVTPILFDGELVSTGPEWADTEVTLEDIYEAITGRRRPDR